MAIKIQSVQQANEDNGIKILIHSPAGVGKTVLCATAQEKTLIISAESGLLSLAQNQRALIKKGSPTFDPKFCDVVTVKTLEELEEVYNMLEAQISDRVYQWVCLDSITEIAEVVLNKELERSRDPRQAYSALQNTVLNVLKAYRDLPHYDVLFSCKQQRVVDQETSVTSFIPMMPGSKLHQQIPYIFDEVFALRMGKDEEGESFVYVQATRDIQYEAKDRSGTLTDCEPPSLKMIKEKIRSGGELPSENVEKQERSEEASQEEAIAAGHDGDDREEKEPKTSKSIDLDVPDEDQEVVDDS